KREAPARVGREAASDGSRGKAAPAGAKTPSGRTARTNAKAPTIAATNYEQSSRRQRRMSGRYPRLRLYFATLFISAFLLGCETESTYTPPTTPYQATVVPGAYYYGENLHHNGIWIHGVNQTSGWVTFFVFSGSVAGTLNIYDLVSQGMPVFHMSLWALQKSPI